MAKPISEVPQIFATATSPLPLANLDSDFAYVITKLNDLATYSNYVADSGTLNALVLSYPAGIGLSGLNVGTPVQFKPANTNTGAVTLQVRINNVNVGSATAVVDSLGNALSAGMLKNTVIYSAVYDGSKWILQGVLPVGATFPSYVGNALKYLQVNAGETDVAWATVTTLPSSTGKNTNILRVTPGGVVEWTDKFTVTDSSGTATAAVTATSNNATFQIISKGTSGQASTLDLYHQPSNTHAYIELLVTSGGQGTLNYYGPYAGPQEWYNIPSGGSAAKRMTLDTAGNLSLQTAGTGFRVKEGSNAKQGTAVLVGGAVTVSNTSVTANSRIFLTSQVDGGTPGFLRVSSRIAGTSFTVTSSSATDTSTVAYIIFEPA